MHILPIIIPNFNI